MVFGDNSSDIDLQVTFVRLSIVEIHYLVSCSVAAVYHLSTKGH